MNFPTPRSWRKQPLSLPGLSASVGLPRPSTMAFFSLVLPNSFLWLSALYGAQPLSQGPLPVGWPNHPLQWQCLCQSVLAVHLPSPYCHDPLPIHAKFSATVLCLWRLYNPEALALCSYELPRPSDPIDYLTTLSICGIVPSPSPTSYHNQCELPRLSHPVLCLSSHSRMNNGRVSCSFLFLISPWFSASG